MSAMVGKFERQTEQDDTKEQYLTCPELEISPNKVGEQQHEIHVIYKWKEGWIGLLPDVQIVIGLDAWLIW
jgi:hypothetical protein